MWPESAGEKGVEPRLGGAVPVQEDFEPRCGGRWQVKKTSSRRSRGAAPVQGSSQRRVWRDVQVKEAPEPWLGRWRRRQEAPTGDVEVACRERGGETWDSRPGEAPHRGRRSSRSGCFASVPGWQIPARVETFPWPPTFRFVMETVYSAAMATPKQRSKKSSAASSKPAGTTASRPGSKNTASKGGPAGKAAPRKTAAPARTAGQPRETSAGAGGPKAAAGRKVAKAAAAPGKAGLKAGRAGAASSAGKAGKAARGAAGTGKSSTRQTAGEAALFAPLTDGERAEALRLLTEDARLATMANVGRYRVIAVEPLTVKAPAELASHRLARVVVYDYSSERSVDSCIDLDAGKLVHLNVTRTQPMLSREEESTAISIALTDEQVRSKLAPGDEPQAAMHYWSHSDASLAYARRAAAVLFGQPRGATSLIAVVDLLDSLVCEIVPAAEW